MRTEAKSTAYGTRVGEMTADLLKRMGKRAISNAPESIEIEHIIPSYPPIAAVIQEKHERDTGKPALVMDVSKMPGQCPNCGGLGSVYMRLCKAGPFSAPVGAGQAVTWFDGNERFGRGWYVVGATHIWDCPKCGGAK